MPTITDVSLVISSNQAAATVSGTMNFDSRDKGRDFKMTITLYGEDLPGDQTPSNDPEGDDLLVHFQWAYQQNRRLLFRQYKLISAAPSGPMPFSDRQLLLPGKLDEDPGFKIIRGQRPGDERLLNRVDEIYAKVELTEVPIPPVSVRSSTVTIGVGV